MVEVEREVMEVAMEAGHILLENGAEIFRVEETINRICRHYGISDTYVANGKPVLRTLWLENGGAWRGAGHALRHV